MGIHTGEPTFTGDGYVGVDVHRAARVMGAGHGGQVLLTHAACALADDNLPVGITLRDLGLHRLKDMPHREHIYQLAIQGLPTDFPPLKSIGNRPNNLPFQLTPLIGRDREVREACDLLRRDTVRLLTLTGAGGSGKTRLSLQVAGELLEFCEDGAFFVSLAPLVDPSQVLSAIAQTLSFNESDGQSLLRLLQKYLQDKSILLVLDNFEQVVEAAPVVTDLLTACPKLKVLVTSRGALRVSGEHEFPVQPLGLPDLKQLPSSETLSQYAAVELFIQRAVAVKPDFAVTNENAPAVAEICVRLDGLPLAIELAAARIRLFSPQSMLSQLGLSLLTGGARDLPARQQTLRNTISWSYELLEEDEKSLFRILSVFAGGFTFGAAQAVYQGCKVAADQPDQHPRLKVLDAIASLVDKSLLRRAEVESGHRFEMLEMIREFAQDMLEQTGRLNEARRVHADYYLKLAEPKSPVFQRLGARSGFERLGAEHANLHSALQYFRESERGQAASLALLLHGYWESQGHWVEARKTIEGLLKDEKDISTETKIGLLRNLASIIYLQGNFTRSLELLEMALQHSREIGNKHNEAEILSFVGSTKFQIGDSWEVVQSVLSKSLDWYREIDDKSGMVRVLNNLGALAQNQRDFKKADALYQECLSISRELNVGVGVALFNVGEIKIVQNDLVSGRQRWQESLRAFQDEGCQEMARFVERALKRLDGEASDIDLALRRAEIEEAIARARKSGNKESVAYDLWGLAGLAGRMGEPANARAYLEESLVQFLQLRKLDGAASVLYDLAWGACKSGDFDEAKSFVERSIQLYRDEGDSVGVINATDSMALLHFRQGRFPEAHRIFEAALSAKEARQDGPGMAWSMMSLGFVAYLQDDLSQCESWLERGWGIYQTIDSAQYGSIGASLSQTEGYLRLAQGDHTRARYLFSKVIKYLGDPNSPMEPHTNLGGNHRWVLAVEAFGRLAVACGEVTRAARLWGMAESFREEKQVETWPCDQALHEPAVAVAREAISEAEFAAAWAEGRAMTWQQAVEYALEDGIEEVSRELK